MSDDAWNDDIAYEFSIHRTFMQIFGVWPLQKRTIATIIQWNIGLFLQLSPLIFLFMEFAGNNGDARTNIDVILCLRCILGLTLKYISIGANRGKLAKNIKAAAADWVSAKNDEKSNKIMKKYAFKSRLCTLLILYTSFTCGSLYILSVLVVNLIEIFLQDQIVNISDGNVSATDRLFIIPCGELGNKINGLQYTMVIGLQIVQSYVICAMQPITDGLYISVTLHLTGQLKVLKQIFKNFASKPDTQINHRKHFISLINRHCELTELNQNLEDTFNLIILFELVIVTLLLALLGLRIIFCLKYHSYIDLMKNSLLMNYMFIQMLMYCYGGDFVQKGSEGIFHAMFKASCFTLPASMMKDLNFAMMRSSYPFRLTGGKFFYANCEVIVYFLKAAASYISVLRMALKD